MKMNLKIILLLSLLLSVVCLTIDAQPDDRRPQISGQLVDADLKEPVVQATIQLFTVSDSTFVGGTVSDLEGTFSIEAPSRGTYRLRISSIGYQTIEREVTATQAFQAKVNSWGPYYKYNYVKFDFTAVKTSGVYYIQYGKTRTNDFLIDEHVYDKITDATTDVWCLST